MDICSKKATWRVELYNVLQTMTIYCEKKTYSIEDICIHILNGLIFHPCNNINKNYICKIDIKNSEIQNKYLFS